MSDHFSGPRAIAMPHGDITDVFAFPSPTRPRHLVLAMDVHPNAGATVSFSDGIVCQLRVRPVTISTGASGAAFTLADEEFTFTFSFGEPVPGETHERPAQEAVCQLPTGAVVTFAVDDPLGGSDDGVRVFAGLRSDPFAFDLEAWRTMVLTGRVPLKEVGVNVRQGANVLSVVAEIEWASVFGPRAGSLFAVIGETLGAGKLPVRLERVGRPEIKNMLIGLKDFDLVNRDLDLHDLYNSEDGFHLGHGYLGAYRARLNANLAFWDSLDVHTAWPLDEHGNHPLTDLFLQDFLVVDASKPYTEQSYLEIERALLDGRSHTTCGGRSLNDNVIDAAYTFLIKRGTGPPIRQGVDRATQRPSEIFPYLAPPNPERGAQCT